MTSTTAGRFGVIDLARSDRHGLIVRRGIGAWVDLVVLASFLLVPDLVLGNDRYQATVYIWLGLLIAYFPLTEGLAGRSLGKVVTGTVVVTAEGTPPGVARATVRTLTRVLEVNPCLFGGVPAGVVVLTSRHHQRLGDMAARTYVVKAVELRGLRSAQ